MPLIFFADQLLRNLAAEFTPGADSVLGHTHLLGACGEGTPSFTDSRAN